MDDVFQLSTEQEFGIRIFSDQVQSLTQAQAQEFLVKLYRQMMVKETMYKRFLSQGWRESFYKPLKQ